MSPFDAPIPGPARLDRFPVHLGPGGVARGLPEFDGSGAWYGAYEAATEVDGADGRLVSFHSFTEPWTSWEVHPLGHELVVCVAGEIELIQEIDGATVRTRLAAGEWAINPPGVWHTADVAPEVGATCLFITAGRGTDGRER